MRAVQVCPRDYTSVLLQWVDPESLPEYLGGTSKATLLDDAGPWQVPPRSLASDACAGRPFNLPLPPLG